MNPGKITSDKKTHRHTVTCAICNESQSLTGGNQATIGKEFRLFGWQQRGSAGSQSWHCHKCGSKSLSSHDYTSTARAARRVDQLNAIAKSVIPNATWRGVETLIKNGEIALAYPTNEFHQQEIDDLKELLPQLHPCAAALLEDVIVGLERALKLQE